MSKREENLKKINSELEKLSDEELEGVAGGNFGETRVDSKILYNHGLMDTSYTGLEVMFSWVSVSSKVDAAWAKIGITCVTKPWLSSNQYFKDGKEITRDEAIKYVKENFKKIHDLKED